MLNYKKPAFWITLAAAAACVVAGACLSSNPKEKNDTPYVHPNAEQLFEHRTAYVGDHSAVENITGLLEFPSDVRYDHIELQTSSEPYGVDVCFSAAPAVRAAYETAVAYFSAAPEPKSNFHAPGMEDIDAFMENACVMLSLIKNADEITFRLNDESGSPADLPFTREWAEGVVGADLWEESSSAEQLDSLMTEIHEDVENAVPSTAEDISTGPFVGYVKDTNAGTFDVYTRKNGKYVMSLPMSLFGDFPANRFDPGWMDDIDFYCGSIGDFTWAVVCTGPSGGTGNENVCTSPDGGKTWWVGDRSAMCSGTGTGAGFASSKVGFISYRYFAGRGPEIGRTTDGGKTWSRMTVEVPDDLKGYRMTPLVPTFIGSSGSYPIKLYADDGSTSMACLATEDGGMTWEWKESALEAAVGSALLKDNQTHYLDGECAGEGHILLGKEEKSGVVTAYALTMYGEYGFEDGNFVKVSGSGIIPAVFTFTDSDGGLVCTKIEYPEDGARYGDSIRKLFPSEYRSMALSPSDGDKQNLSSQERSYAASYLKKIGRDAAIGDYGDFEHTLLTDVGVSVDVSNSINDKLFANYPMWIGNREALENGVRYVYEKSYNKAAHEIVFTKYEYDTNKIVERTRLDSITGKTIAGTANP